MLTTPTDHTTRARSGYSEYNTQFRSCRLVAAQGRSSQLTLEEQRKHTFLGIVPLHYVGPGVWSY